MDTFQRNKHKRSLLVFKVSIVLMLFCFVIFPCFLSIILAQETQNLTTNKSLPTQQGNSVVSPGIQYSRCSKEEIEKRFSNLVNTSIENHQNVRGEINLEETEKTKEGMKLLARITSLKLSDFLVIDDNRIREFLENFSKEKKTEEDLRKQNLPLHVALDELYVPFYVDVVREGDKNKYVFVTSKEFCNLNDSKFLYYVTFLKAYAALPEYFKSKPSVWAYGLCSLIAEDALYRTNMATYPELEVETAIAALLIKKEPALLWNAYLEDETRFSGSAYESLLGDTIRKMGGEDPKKALEGILQSPEDHSFITKAIKEQMKANPDKESLPYVPPVEQLELVLWFMLPSTEDALKSFANNISSEINQLTLRCILLNACYDKLCAVFGLSKNGALENSSTFLRKIAEGFFEKERPDLAGEAKMLQEIFEKKQKYLLEEFEDELRNRNQTSPRLTEIAYDPSALKWLFRYLYNYSYPIRKKVEELAVLIKKEFPGHGQEQIDEEVCKRITKEKVLELWNADTYLKQLLDKVGLPDLQLGERQETKVGKRLKCTWFLNRRLGKGQEQVKVIIIDPFSSGGGKPKKGVSSKAEVVVRKTLESEPEKIELGAVEKGFYVRTASRIDRINGSADDNQENMQEDWARVVEVIQEGTTSCPWSLESGAGKALDIGGIQQVRVEEKEDSWIWKTPLNLSQEKDKLQKNNLLGISPEGVTGKGENATFSPVQLKNSTHKEEELQLITLVLSHREVEKLKESGEEEWGYFANARLVHAPVVQSPRGVDGEASIQIPGGESQVSKLRAHKDKGDEVNAFGFGNPGTFVERLRGSESILTDYVITITYELPGGITKSLQVAEGQSLVVYSEPNITLKKAYQLKKGEKLACAFQGELSQPVTATITGLKGEEKKLGVYTLKLKELPLARVNGIFIPVETERSSIFPGIQDVAHIQMSPGLEEIKNSKSDWINVSGAMTLLARDVPIYAFKEKAVKTVATGGNNLILMYHVSKDKDLDVKTFGEAGIVNKEADRCNSYMKISTAQTTLVCGHIQEIFVSESNSLNELSTVEAREIKLGQKVVYLNKDDGKLSLVPVKSVEQMYPVETADDTVVLIEFAAADSNMNREAFDPTMFANGILVKINPALKGEGEGPGWKGEGKTPGKTKTPETTGPGKHIPHYDGIIRDDKFPKMINFDAEDLKQFTLNRQGLESAFANANFSLVKVRGTLGRFLEYYFSYDIGMDVYNKHIGNYFSNYLNARDFLLSTRDARLLPTVVIEYVFLATLLYEAEAKGAGDWLTRDFLCILIRTLKTSEGTYYFNSDKTKIRNAIEITRDLLLYVRDKSDKSGFENIVTVSFPAESMEGVITDYFIKKKGCNEDILNKTEVLLHNLFLQLNKWAGNSPRFPQSIVAPDFQPGKIFSSNHFAEQLGIKQRTQ